MLHSLNEAGFKDLYKFYLLSFSSLILAHWFTFRFSTDAIYLDLQISSFIYHFGLSSSTANQCDLGFNR